MKKYWVIIKSSASELFQYRSNFFLEILANILLVVTMIGVWFAIFQTQEKVGGYTIQGMVSYLLIAALLHSFLAQRQKGDDVNDDINRGDLSFHLVRPMNVPVYWFLRDVVKGGILFFLSAAEILLLLFAFRSYLEITIEAAHVLLFLVSVLGAFILNYLMFHIFSLMAFWMEQTWGPRFILRIVGEVATGAMLPLSLFPDAWQTIFAILPFQYIIYIPVQIFIGNLNGIAIVQAFLISSAWICILAYISVTLWKRGLLSYNAEGS